MERASNDHVTFMAQTDRSPQISPRPSGWSSVLLTLLLLALVAAGLRNALALEPTLEAQAHNTACASPLAPANPSSPPTAPPPRKPPPPPCRMQLTRSENNVLARTFVYETSTTRTRIQCRRDYWALGDYHCDKAP